MKIHTFRLKQGKLLRKSIQDYANKHKLEAALIISVVAGLKDVTLRMPGAKTIKEFNGDFELVSIQGTLSADDCHIHIAVSDKDGKVVGGHLKEAFIRITAEVSLLELTDRKFLREFDPDTGFKELTVK